jgi:hypothetical protein
MEGANGGDGGGIYSAGALALSACTVSFNSDGAEGRGGFNAVSSAGDGFTGNGGGINASSGVLRNTLIANNQHGNYNPPISINPGYGVDLYGNFSSQGNNLVGDNTISFGGFTLNQLPSDIVPPLYSSTNAMLSSFDNHGGSTATVALLPGSPAIDAGDDTLTNTTAFDQRGFPRRVGPHVDIGAFEYTSVSTIVTNTADSGGGSLRDAVTYSTNGTTITFASALSGQTNTLAGGQLTTYVSLAVDASALANGFRVSGNGSNRIFEVSAGMTLKLNSLFLMNGYAGSSGSGGAILVDGGGALTLNNSTVSSNSAGVIGGGIGNFSGVVNINNSTLSGNSASGAGAIENDAGTLTISASTLSGNFSAGNGGAIDNDAGATLLVNNSTFSGNSAVGGGGGIENYQASATLNNVTLSANSAGGAAGINNYGTLDLTNAIVAGNTAPIVPDINLDSSGSFNGANNLTSDNPLLAPLGNYSGPTQTMPPLPGSPAIDAGSDSVTNFLATDQRGYPRLSGAHVDIGAVEVLFVAANPGNRPALKNPVWSLNGGSNTFQFTFTNVSGADFTALTTTNLALPLTNWTVLGSIPEISPGQFQFTDPGATNYPRRFYMVVSP